MALGRISLRFSFEMLKNSMLTYMMVEALARAYEKLQGKCGPEPQVLGARLEAHGKCCRVAQP
jgi:hypothetical protein